MTRLPEGWDLVTLNDLRADEPRAITDGPFGSNLTSAHYTESGARVVRLQNIGDGRFVDAEAYISMDHFATLRQHEVLPGDLLVGSLGEILPRACLAPAGLGPTIVKADCIRVRLGPRVDHRWVVYALQTPSVRRWSEARTHGVGRPRLGLKVIRELPVPLPPIEEQRRIVDILEDHLSRLDAAHRYLVHSERLGRSLRYAILERLASSPADVISLLDLALEAGYGTSAKCSEGGPGAPVVRIPNLVNGHVDMRDEKRVADAGTDVSRLMLRPGDLLIVRTNGSRDLIGRSAVVQAGVEAAFASYLIRFRLDESRVDPTWVLAMLEAPAMRRRLEGLAASSAGQYNLGLKKLASLPIPVPSLHSQRRALALAEEQLGGVGRLVEGAQIGVTRASTLRAALLQAAFSGGLTDPSRFDLVEELAGV